MLKITRSTEAGTTTLALSGRVGSEHLPDLRRCLEEDRGQAVVLDLGEVTLVDVDVVRFLVECQTRAIRLAECPGYVREWMVREKSYQSEGGMMPPFIESRRRGGSDVTHGNATRQERGARTRRVRGRIRLARRL
jgi:ABC-type transporter Mla MlaB component